MSRRFSIGKILLTLLAAVGGIAVLFFLISLIAAYRPADREELFRTDRPTPLSDTLTIVTWNIGYGGLGDNMDFFYDGGTQVRDTRARTEANFSHILATLRAIDADIMLLQEIDEGSRRSYGIRQTDSLRRAFPDHTLTYAYNYKAWCVPIPPGEPMGRVRSGLAMLSRAVPVDAVRYQYPSAFPFPVRMFNLKRALLSARFLTPAGDTVLISNTHNTAFDTGHMRKEEMYFLNDLLESYRQAGVRSLTGGDWNQFPPGYSPAEAEVSNPDFVPHPVPAHFFDDRWQFVYDTLHPSLRFVDRPLAEGAVTTLTDFFLLSDGFEVLSIATIPEHFRASDHNPVVLRVAVKFPPRSTEPL